ncbi:hypothetical protein [Phycisphaera mikurensis]|uniref:Uncharacterized protein n=1 Tax=Phycisphaera mikurensis (strain NBRC 102666 / KCTC 22515 / FYK2301M01) TaxID=1142394 RepID=I0IDM4_PHYMF|nr:hypothetical protein [Phycisphaera mikurensis]MBB6441181.1 hypothetical protein [Phycisphaera mikurensis]BAM03362.1 hypothetical protein PSMK_12030 [Phycisphaera mikurensis NBRC 102666]
MTGVLAQASADGGEPVWVQALLVGGILLVIASLMTLLRNRKRGAASSTTARDRLDHARADARLKDGQRKDLEAVSIAIEEMARRVGAQLDNKASRVEALLDEAERVIHRLDAATRAAAVAAARAPEAAGPAAPPAIGSGAPPPPSPPPPSPPPAAADALRAEVSRLATEGLDPPAIAARTGEHVGKIELILALARG